MLARLAIATSLLLVVASCATEPAAVTLMDTKASVQLLRNEARYRLPDLMIKTDSETSDVSVACDAELQGLLRYWQSSTIALMNNSFAPRAVSVADSLVASFTKQGWVAARTEEPGFVHTELTRAGSFAMMTIEAVLKSDDARAHVRITANGPCVRTEGRDSAEVELLEREY